MRYDDLVQHMIIKLDETVATLQREIEKIKNINNEGDDLMKGIKELLEVEEKQSEVTAIDSDDRVDIILSQLADILDAISKIKPEEKVEEKTEEKTEETKDVEDEKGDE